MKERIQKLTGKSFLQKCSKKELYDAYYNFNDEAILDRPEYYTTKKDIIEAIVGDLEYNYDSSRDIFRGIKSYKDWFEMCSD